MVTELFRHISGREMLLFLITIAMVALLVTMLLAVLHITSIPYGFIFAMIVGFIVGVLSTKYMPDLARAFETNTISAIFGVTVIFAVLGLILPFLVQFSAPMYTLGSFKISNTLVTKLFGNIVNNVVSMFVFGIALGTGMAFGSKVKLR